MILHAWCLNLPMDQIWLCMVQVPLLFPKDLALDTDGIVSVHTVTWPQALWPQATIPPEPAQEAIPTPEQLVMT